MTLSSAQEFWNDPQMVRQFAEREPDIRLLELIDAISDPASHHVLDLGCAGGRNTELLVARGFPVCAIDFAPAMVEQTRARIASRIGTEAAVGSVHQGRMDDLVILGDRSIHTVLALGILQQAITMEEWNRTLDEITRVLVPEGRCLVANFAPGTGPIDAPFPSLLPGTEFLYENKRFGAWCLPNVEQLDAEFARRGLRPVLPTEMVERVADDQRRRTVNALYAKLT